MGQLTALLRAFERWHAVDRVPFAPLRTGSPLHFNTPPSWP